MDKFDEWLQDEPWPKEPDEEVGDMEPYDQYSDDKLTEEIYE